MRSSRSPDHPALAHALGEGVVVLDGGLATRSRRAGTTCPPTCGRPACCSTSRTRSSRRTATSSRAGAQVATTASYQVSFAGFAARGLDAADTAPPLRRSVELAAAARATMPADRPRWVAASVGPYGAALADGSEYRGDYGRSVAELRAWHRPRLEALMDTDADVLALETIPCLAEVEALLAEVDGTGRAVLAVADRARTRRRAPGEPVDEAFAMAADVEEVVAVGVNCCDPGRRRRARGRAAATARAGRPWPTPTAARAGTPSHRAWRGPRHLRRGLGQEWTAAGARLVGGCCRVLPGHHRRDQRRRRCGVAG